MYQQVKTGIKKKYKQLLKKGYEFVAVSSFEEEMDEGATVLKIDHNNKTMFLDFDE